MKTNEQFGSGVTREVYTLWNVVLDQRMARAMSEGVSRYPIYRVVHFAARVELDVLLDAIALDPAWRAERVSYGELLLDGDGVFIVGEGSRKVDYCSCSFYVWAADVARAQAAKQRLLDKAGSTRITEPMFRVEWNFVTLQGVQSAWIEEMEDRPGWFTGDNSPIALTFGLSQSHCDWVQNTAKLRARSLLSDAPAPDTWYCYTMFDHGQSGC